MLKSNKVFLVSYFNLFRSCRCGKTNLIQTLKMFSTAAHFYKIGLLSLSVPRCPSLYFLGQNERNGNYKGCWKRSSSNSSYITPSGVSFHFDTHRLVRRLQENGFTEAQAESLTTSLVEIITSSVLSVTNSTVSKIDQERLEVKFKGLVDSVRNEMFLLEQGKFARIQEENQKLRDEVKSLKGILEDEVAKLRGGMALDFSLEKSRGKEELAQRDQKIKDTENRIETEVAKLGTQLEAQKLDLIKYIVGSLLSCVTLFLAVWRFVKT